MFSLGAKSLEHLNGVHPKLVIIVKDAISISHQDFTVLEGLRSIEKELEHIKNGTSKLSDPHHCKHCKQSDGFGHAVDLVPFVDGKPNWDWKYIWDIAIAMQSAALRENVKIKWGAVWDRSLNELTVNLKDEVERYKIRHAGKDFEDGPHFELMV